MPTGAQGASLTLDATYTDGTGQAVTPTSPRVSIINPSGTTVVSNATPTAVATGVYEYIFAIPSDAPLGSWTARWSGTINGVATTADEVFTVVEAGSIGFEGSTDVLTLEEAKRALNVSLSDSYSDDELAQVVSAASQWLDEVVGPVVRRTITNEAHQSPSGTVWLRHRPVSSISTVTEWSAGGATVLTSETASTAGTYLADLSAGTLRRRSGWGDVWWNATSVVVTYTAGRFADTADVDARFKEAAVVMLQHLWQSRGAAPTAGVFGAEDSQAFGGQPYSAQGVVKKVRSLLSGDWVPALG
jgi:hypothetical protein